jgi:Sigma-70 region 2
MIKKPRAKNHYVNNKDLYEHMVKYREAVRLAEAEGRDKPQIPNYVGVCFMMICNRLSTKPNFINYSYREDMIADGIENCVAAAHSFDPDKSSNPFAYFTQIAWNAFIRRITKEKKQSYIKHKNFEYTNLLEDLNEESYSTGKVYNNEYSSDIIRNFENKLVKTTSKAKVGIEKFIEEEKNEEPTPSPASGS